MSIEFLDARLVSYVYFYSERSFFCANISIMCSLYFLKHIYLSCRWNSPDSFYKFADKYSIDCEPAGYVSYTYLHLICLFVCLFVCLFT